MNKIKLSDATRPQLLTFARETAGIAGVNAHSKVEELRSKLSACGYEEITVSPDAPIEKPVSKEVSAKKGKKVTVMIANSELAGGDLPVALSVNGKAMSVPRGKMVDIPYEYYEVLKNAVAKTWDSTMEESREVPAYPYQVYA